MAERAPCPGPDPGSCEHCGGCMVCMPPLAIGVSLAELDRLRLCEAALGRIARADHMPYRSFKAYALSERKAMKP